MRLYRHALIALTIAALLGGALVAPPAARAVGIWTPAPALAVPRSGQAAFLLPDGRVLFYGGTPAVGDPTTGELYDPARGSCGVTRPRPDAQGQEAPVLLADGRLLLTGGDFNEDIDPNSARTLATAQTYDPDTDTYTPVAALSIARVNHTATVLPDGAVLVVGGSTGGGVGPGLGTNAVAQAERYAPLTNGWSPAGALVTARSLHTATLLQDGRVLVVGGRTNPGAITATAEVWDAATNTWSPAGQMAAGRIGHTATLLPDGRVLVVGGVSTEGGQRLATAEVYDPTRNAWSAAGDLADARLAHTATLLPDGRVLVAGGDREVANMPNPLPLATAELYDPASGRWVRTTALGIPRAGHSATLLPDGRVLVAGGRSTDGRAITFQATAVFYAAAATPERCFAETGKCARGPFLAYWQAHGGLALNGYPLTDERLEVLEHGNTYIEQYFERIRMEYHPENTPPYDVLLGQFGRRVLRDQFGVEVARYQAAVTAAQPDPRAGPLEQVYFAETSHNVGGNFLAYWRQHGGLAQFGYPLTEVFTQHLAGGSYQVQYFERARFEAHPENAAPSDVLLGQFGRDILAQEDRLSGGFGTLYLADARVRERLGPPLGSAVQGPGATQAFERGRMFSYPPGGSNGLIQALCGDPSAGLVFPNSRLGLGFEDSWDPSQPVGGGPGLQPGLYEPKRGFGKVWRERAGYLSGTETRAIGVRDCLGYATEPDETPYTITVQVFDRGTLLITPDGQAVYVLWAEVGPHGGVVGHYERVALPAR